MPTDPQPTDDLRAILMQHAYPPVFVELHFQMPGPARCVLSIRNGKPTVQPGGSGRITLDPDALRALLEHRATLADLQQAARIAGPAEDLAALARAFAPHP